jgi:hypothetical protein
MAMPIVYSQRSDINRGIDKQYIFFCTYIVDTKLTMKASSWNKIRDKPKGHLYDIAGLLGICHHMKLLDARGIKSERMSKDE